MNEATRTELLARLAVIKAGITRTDQAEELMRVVTLLRDSAAGYTNQGQVRRPLSMRIGTPESISVPHMAVKPMAKAQYTRSMKHVLSDIRDFVVTRLNEELESLQKEQDRGLAEATGIKVADADKHCENRENRGVRVRKS